MSTLRTWWTDKEGENYWLEVTDREGLGANLKAPQANEKGSEFWSYSLLKEVQPGDIVFHYDRSVHSIVAASVASGRFWSDRIVWAARGSYARDAGIEPHIRDGWYVGLESFSRFSEAVSLEDIREQANNLASRLEDLESVVGQPTYFPFERGASRPIRPIQGYLFKLPRFFVELFPALAAYPSGSKQRDPQNTKESWSELSSRRRGIRGFRTRSFFS